MSWLLLRLVISMHGLYMKLRHAVLDEFLIPVLMLQIITVTYFHFEIS